MAWQAFGRDRDLGLCSVRHDGTDDMEDQSQPNKKELAVSSERPGTESVLDPIERQASWQKHVMFLLWISIAVLIVFVGILLYAKYHGVFESPSDQVAPFPAGAAGSR